MVRRETLGSVLGRFSFVVAATAVVIGILLVCTHLGLALGPLHLLPNPVVVPMADDDIVAPPVIAAASWHILGCLVIGDLHEIDGILLLRQKQSDQAFVGRLQFELDSGVGMQKGCRGLSLRFGGFRGA